jgi:DNA-binding response OmpR family regulator
MALDIASPASDQRSSAKAGERVLERGVRVLLADDDVDTLITLAELLQRDGFDVKMVLNGGPVVAVASYYRPHIVLLDIGMPDRNGFKVAAELRAIYGDQAPVLIAITGLSGAAEKIQSEKCGFDHYIRKPYDPVQLLELIASLAPKS